MITPVPIPGPGPVPPRARRARRAILRLAIPLLASAPPLCPGARAAAPPPSTLTLTGGLTLPYFISTPEPQGAPSAALIAVQGYPRDANRSFEAAARAAREAGQAARTLIIAPIFQVLAAEAARYCHFRGMPAARPGNALWHCGTWLNGAPAINTPETSFEALTQLIDHVLRRYPSIQVVTIAGFSAGGQFVQRDAAFAAPLSRPVTRRYVVADPGTFLYFNRFRPKPGRAACPGYNNWKFGTDHLPAFLGRTAAAARAAYIRADIHYLEGARDHGRGRGTAASGCSKKTAPPSFRAATASVAARPMPPTTGPCWRKAGTLSPSSPAAPTA